MHRDLWGGIHGDLQGGMHGDLLGDMHRDLRVVFTGTSGWHAQGPSEWHAQEPRVAFTGTSGVASTGTMVACMVTSRVACTGTSKVACTGTSGWRSQGPSGWHAPEPSGWHAQGLWGCVDGDLQSGMQRDLRVAFTRTSGWHAQGPLGWHAQGPRGGVQKDIRSGMHRDLQGGVHRDLQDGGVRGPPLWHAQEPQGGMHRDLGVVCTGTSRAALNPYGSFNARHCGSSILHLLSANAMALDWRGEYTLLAGRRNLALISLNKPSEVVKRVSRTRQKYDVTAAEWNPIQSQGHTFVLASGERAEICQWTEGSLNGTTSLRAHTRTITDLNWHRFDPHVLATCSIDTFVHIWDTRETRKPVASLSAIAGASQVKWNKLNHNFLASGHDCNIRVWDNRKTSQPAQYIAAHLSKIQGLDWSPNHENHLVTSSNDCTVKFFNITNPRKAENFINTLSPVWRARYTPFGEGVVTVVVPQLRRGENSLLLWSVTDMSAPVHTFVGHSDVVLEFEWRQNTNNPGEHQLVTWARDQSLRIWKIDQHLQRLCGHDIEDDAAFAESTDSEFANEAAPVQGESECDMEKFDEKDKTGEQDTLDPVQDTKQQCTQQNAENTERASHENSPEIGLATSDAPQTYDELQGSLTNDQFTGDTGTANVPVLPPVTSFLNTVSAPIRTNHNVVSLTSTLPSGGISAGQPMSLQQEFSLLNTSLDNSQVNSVEVVTEVEKRLCQVTAKHKNHTVCLNINFPLTYPRQHTPIFRFSYGTTIDISCKTDLLKVLKTTASQYQRKHKACLEPCIRVFVNHLKELLGDDRLNSIETPLGNGYSGQVYGSYQDHRVPFPRTSGARFSSAGLLVCFTRPMFMKKGSSRTESSTPRSLSALGAYIKNYMAQKSSTVPTSPKYSYIYPALSHSPSIEHSVSISHYYYQDKKFKSKRGKNEDEVGRSFNVGSVLIYDVKSLMPLSRDLGASYVLDENDIVGACLHNRDAAAAVGRRDLVQLWSLAAATTSLRPGLSINAWEYTDSPWILHPFARKLVNSILDHYVTMNDVQTVTMICCTFGMKMEPQNTTYARKGRAESNSHIPEYGSLKRNQRQTSVWAKLDRLSLLRGGKMGGSPYNTIHCLSLEGWDTCTVRHNRSNSEGSLSEATRPQEVDLPALESTDTHQKNLARFLDCNRGHQFDEMKRAYADILYRWGLLQQRAMVLKYLQVQPPAHKGVEFQTDCVHCGQSAKGPQCLYCRRFSFSCAICHVAVKGASNFCIVCGHGGHAYHLLEWFRDHDECPTGCGCDCIEEMDHLFR
nr:GATOR complex protein WDR59-like isoform X4 [Cherax quadricarinatus]